MPLDCRTPGAPSLQQFQEVLRRFQEGTLTEEDERILAWVYQAQKTPRWQHALGALFWAPGRAALWLYDHWPSYIDWDLLLGVATFSLGMAGAISLVFSGILAIIHHQQRLDTGLVLLRGAALWALFWAVWGQAKHLHNRREAEKHSRR